MAARRCTCRWSGRRWPWLSRGWWWWRASEECQISRRESSPNWRLTEQRDDHTSGQMWRYMWPDMLRQSGSTWISRRGSSPPGPSSSWALCVRTLPQQHDIVAASPACSAQMRVIATDGVAWWSVSVLTLCVRSLRATTPPRLNNVNEHNINPHNHHHHHHFCLLH